MTRTRLRRRTELIAPSPELSVEIAEPRITGDARIVAGGTVTDQARAGGHSTIVGAAVVAEHAVVTDHTVIAGHARICGTATVSGHAAVIDGAWVGGSAWIFDRAVIRGLASVGEQAQAFGTALVAGQATITDQAWVFGRALVDGQARIGGRARISGGRVTGTARIEGDIRIRPGTFIGDRADLREPNHLHLMELAHRVHATLYRCDDGAVGAGLPDGWHGPLNLGELPEELRRHSQLVHELAHRWAPETVLAQTITPVCGSREMPRHSADPHRHPSGPVPTIDIHFVDDEASWAQWAPPLQFGGEPDVGHQE